MKTIPMKTSEEEKVKLPDIIGRFGNYQVFVLLLSYCSSVFFGAVGVNVELFAPTVDLFWDWEANDSNRTVFSSTNCKMKSLMEYNRSSEKSNQSSKLVHESPYSTRTLTAELGLICENSWKISFANTMFCLGCFLGNMLFSRLTEKFGRKPTTICIVFIGVVSNISFLFLRNYIVFLIVTFINGAVGCHMDMFQTIQAVEILPKSMSRYAGACASFGVITGQIMLVGVAWLLQNWLHIQIFQTVYVAAVFVMTLFMLESPMWLAVRGRNKEVVDSVTTILERNRIDVAEAKPKLDKYLADMKTFFSSNTDKGKITDLFKNRVIIFYTLAICFTRIANFAVFNSIIMNAQTFGSGLYVDLLISAVFAIGSALVALAFLTKISVRILLIICYVFEGSTCAAYTLIYSSPLGRTIISVIGRCFISPINCVSLVYINEVYPTSVRGIGSGFCGMIGRLFAAASPFTKELGTETKLYVPFLIFSGFSYIAALLYKLLPETKGKEFVNTVEELVKVKRREKVTTSIYSISTNL